MVGRKTTGNTSSQAASLMLDDELMEATTEEFVEPSFDVTTMPARTAIADVIPMGSPLPRSSVLEPMGHPSPINTADSPASFSAEPLPFLQEALEGPPSGTKKRKRRFGSPTRDAKWFSLESEKISMLRDITGMDKRNKDENTLFAESLIPTLQTLPEDTAMDLKIGILQLVRKAKQQTRFVRGSDSSCSTPSQQGAFSDTHGEPPTYLDLDLITNFNK